MFERRRLKLWGRRSEDSKVWEYTSKLGGSENTLSKEILKIITSKIPFSAECQNHSFVV